MTEDIGAAPGVDPDFRDEWEWATTTPYIFHPDEKAAKPDSFMSAERIAILFHRLWFRRVAPSFRSRDRRIAALELAVRDLSAIVADLEARAAPAGDLTLADATIAAEPGFTVTGATIHGRVQ